MIVMKTTWIKPILILSALLGALWFLPSDFIKTEYVFNPQKVALIIFSLALIQVLSSFLITKLDSKSGARLSGFLGGLISSTATTLLVARQSKIAGAKEDPVAMVILLASIVGMLLEILMIIIVGSQALHFSLFLLFLGPILLTEAVIFFLVRQLKSKGLKIAPQKFEVLPLLKLTVFIVAILAVSKFFQDYFGRQGLILLTFFTSLFEIHGSVAANLEMFAADLIDIHLLALLLTLSIIASSFSKLILLWTIGRSSLALLFTKYFVALIVAVLLSWLSFFMFHEL